MEIPRPYFVLQTFHWHARGVHRNLWTIWARALKKKVRQPYSNLTCKIFNRSCWAVQIWRRSGP